MSHNVDHDHPHGHPHGHTHTHPEMTFPQKLVKLLEHWIEHNDQHAKDYRKWASEAREKDQAVVADLLESAADITETISDRFREAGRKVK